VARKTRDEDMNQNDGSTLTYEWDTKWGKTIGSRYPIPSPLWMYGAVGSDQPLKRRVRCSETRKQ
jgi:hypothetical protein